MAISDIHLVANLLDYRYEGKLFSDDQHEKAMQYIAKLDSSVMTDVLKYKAKSFPFSNYLFNSNLEVSALNWWVALKDNISPHTVARITQLHTAISSSAGIYNNFYLKS